MLLDAGIDPALETARRESRRDGDSHGLREHVLAHSDSLNATALGGTLKRHLYRALRATRQTRDRGGTQTGMDRKKLERVIKGDSTAAMKARMVDAGDDLNVVWVDASDNAARVVCVLSRACPYEFAVDGDASTGHAAERVSLTVCGSLP